MIYYKKITSKERIIYCLENINEDTSHIIIPKYLEQLGCKIVFRVNEIPLDYNKYNIIFRFIGYDDMMGPYFCSPKQKMESDEYYEKLEKIVKELVDSLNSN